MRLSALVIALSFFALSPLSQASIVAGHDYEVLSTPQRQQSNGKVAVVEFFPGVARIAMSFIPNSRAGCLRYRKMPVSGVFRWV